MAARYYYQEQSSSLAPPTASDLPGLVCTPIRAVALPRSMALRSASTQITHDTPAWTALRMIGIGSVVWAVGVAPFVAITRPADLDKSMDHLIMRPVRYTFADPLGHH